MNRLLVALPFVALFVAVAARADGPPPSVQQIRSAAAEYDAGRRAFVEKDYDGAAAHFENAFNDAPSAEALRSAIRARRKAGQLARAATLAELAGLKYPKDAPTKLVVRDTLAESTSKLHKITLSCAPECGVAADGRAISVADSAQSVFFLEPGSHDLVVSWSNDRTKTQKVSARAGGHDEIVMEAPPIPVPPIGVLPPGAAAPVMVSLLTPVPRGSPEPVADVSTKPFGPAIFIAGAVLTAGGIGFVTWSGINAEQSPGTAKVMAQCTGAMANDSCPAYQQGLAAQLRTNIALGVTGGVALTTAVVGIFFTQWSAPKRRSALLALEPIGGFLPGGATLGLAGTF